MNSIFKSFLILGALAATSTGFSQSLQLIQKLKDPQFPIQFPVDWANFNKMLSTTTTEPSSDVTVPEVQGGKLRVLEYNILRNMKYSRLETLLSKCESLSTIALSPLTASEKAKLCEISKSDIVLINEADRGHCRSDYRDGAKSLAEAMKFHYTYGIEFVEVGPKSTGLQQGDGPLCKVGEVKADALNQHGNAVLSRFPIISAERMELPQCFDWFTNGGSQTRRGGRMALITEIKLPAPYPSMLAIAAHLENKTNSDCRNVQMAAIIKRVEEIEAQKGVRMDVIIGGDMNTTLGSAGPMKELWKSKSFDYGHNNGSTFGPMRLDYIVTRDRMAPQSEPVFKAVSGETVGLVKEKLQSISDHTPIYIDVKLRPL